MKVNLRCDAEALRRGQGKGRRRAWLLTATLLGGCAYHGNIDDPMASGGCGDVFQEQWSSQCICTP